MPKTEMEERLEVQAKFKEQALKDGTCTAYKVFDLGGNGTVYTGCGKPAAHEANDNEMYVDYDPESQFHQTQRKNDDGSIIVFRWPV
jgi:hypothetical protein